VDKTMITEPVQLPASDTGFDMGLPWKEVCRECTKPRLPNMGQRVWNRVQFQPREFSAMTGAEICCVRTLRP
jgi:hypothetical protein